MAERPTQEQMQQMMREEYNARMKGYEEHLQKEGRRARMHDYDEHQKMLAKDFAEEEKETRRASGTDKEAAKRQRALRSFVNNASDIKKLNKSDISKVSSFANKAAKDLKAPETKNFMKEVLKQTSATKSLLSLVAKGVGLIGAAATMNEFRRVHNEIKKKGSGRYGSKTLMEILKK